MESRDLFRCFGPLDGPKGADLPTRLGHVVTPIGSSGLGLSAPPRGCTRQADSRQGESRLEGKAVHQRGEGLNRDPAGLAPVTVLKWNLKEVEAMAPECLAPVGIADLVDDLPAQLSRGQQPRVTMAWALRTGSRTPTFDGPTSARDPELEQELLRVIKAAADAGRTMRPFTQDMKHAADCGDHLNVPRQRKIEEERPTERPFGCPQSERLRGFLSAMVA